MNKNNKGFVTVTNKDIYDKLVDVEKHVIKTNGRVKLAFWMATTGISISITVVVLLVGHMNK